MVGGSELLIRSRKWREGVVARCYPSRLSRVGLFNCYFQARKSSPERCILPSATFRRSVSLCFCPVRTFLSSLSAIGVHPSIGISAPLESKKASDSLVLGSLVHEIPNRRQISIIGAGDIRRIQNPTKLVTGSIAHIASNRGKDL